MFIVYIIAGILLGLFFEFSEKFMERCAKKLRPVVRELAAGAILGLIGSLLPIIQFSGEEAMADLIAGWQVHAPLALIGISILKVIMTNMCIQSGLKGGHFFPLIFAAVCFGYGISLMVFPDDATHAAFAAAVVTAATLGVTMKKPLAVSMLLLLCFPFKTLLWIVPAAALAAFAGRYLDRRSAAADMAQGMR